MESGSRREEGERGSGTGWTLSEARLLGREAVSLRAQDQKKACFPVTFSVYMMYLALYSENYI